MKGNPSATSVTFSITAIYDGAVEDMRKIGIIAISTIAALTVIGRSTMALPGN